MHKHASKAGPGTHYARPGRLFYRPGGAGKGGSAWHRRAGGNYRSKGGIEVKGKSDWVDDKSLDLALRLLSPQDQLIMQVVLKTGLRISDVLTLKREQIKPRLTVRESKTGKSRRVWLGDSLAQDILAQAGETWAFPGAVRRPNQPETHRSRQAVWRDLRRAAAACRIDATLSPHSGRKVWAVDQYNRTGSVEQVQQMMQHDHLSTTLLYVMADKLSQQRGRKGGHKR